MTYLGRASSSRADTSSTSTDQLPKDHDQSQDNSGTGSNATKQTVKQQDIAVGSQTTMTGHDASQAQSDVTQDHLPSAQTDQTDDATSLPNPTDQTLDGTDPSIPPSLSQALQHTTANPNFSRRTHNNQSLDTLYGPNAHTQHLTASSDASEQEQYFDPASQNTNSLSADAKFTSSINFKPEINLSISPVSRCNTISSAVLNLRLNAAYHFFLSTTKLELPTDKSMAIFNTALAWHIAEYRPTAVTHGTILDVEAQKIFDCLTDKQRDITIRRIARAWSRQISYVLQSYASLSPPVFTTQCNDTFSDPHTRLAVAPYFFDGVDPGTIPLNLSRIVASGLAYSKRQTSSSPYSFHKRPAFVSQKEEDFNHALQWSG